MLAIRRRLSRGSPDTCDIDAHSRDASTASRFAPRKLFLVSQGNNVDPKGPSRLLMALTSGLCSWVCSCSAELEALALQVYKGGKMNNESD